MNYDEFKEICRKSCEHHYNYLCFDRTKKKEQGRYCIFSENKNTYIEYIPETELFQ